MTSPTGNLAWQEALQQEEEIRPAPLVTGDAEAGPSTPRKTASRGQKAVAAIAGAVTTSLLMTPFDVVKTRLQTQSSAQPLFAPSQHLSSRGSSSATASSSSAATPSSASSAAPPSSSATCCQQTFFTGNARQNELTCKFDPRLGQSSSSSSSSTPSPASASSAMRVANLQPRSAASSRISPPRPSHYSGLAAYGHTTSFASPSAAGGGGSVAHALNYPSSAASSTTCAYPDRSVAARQLASRNNHLTGLWDGVIKVNRAEGLKGLWRGLSPTLLMTVPSQVTYMTCYEYLRGVLLSLEPPAAALAAQPAPSSPANITYHTLLASLISGAVSRSVSATLVTPLELVRTRLQASDSSHSMRSILTSLSQQVSSEGVPVLWRGLSTTLWRDVPFSAIYFMGYESMKRVLTGGSGLGEGPSTTSTAKAGGIEEFSVAFFSGACSGTVAAVATHPFDLVKTRLQATTSTTSSNSPPSSSSASPSSRKTLSILKTIVKEDGPQGLFRGMSPRIAKVAPACGLMIGSYEAVGTLFAMAGKE